MASDKMLGSFDQKSAPEDNDLLVEYDAAASKVKNVKFGGVWNWIVKKLTSAVINELQTSSKNVVGAINELNSNRIHRISNPGESEKRVTIRANELYDTYIIFGQKSNSGILDIVYTHNNNPLTMLRLDSKLLSYSDYSAGNFCILLPSYSAVHIACGSPIIITENK